MQDPLQTLLNQYKVKIWSSLHKNDSEFFDSKAKHETKLHRTFVSEYITVQLIHNMKLAFAPDFKKISYCEIIN